MRVRVDHTSGRRLLYFPRGGPDKPHFPAAVAFSKVGTTWPVVSQNTLIHNRSLRRRLLWRFHSHFLTVLTPVATSAKLSTSVSPVLPDAASVPPALSPATRITNNSSCFQSASFVVTAQLVRSQCNVRFTRFWRLRMRITSMVKTSTASSVAVADRTMQSQSGKQ